MMMTDECKSGGVIWRGLAGSGCVLIGDNRRDTMIQLAPALRLEGVPRKLSSPLSFVIARG